MCTPQRKAAMAHSDVFALKNSGLNAFLFAEVGIELNGSALTILSLLARLGQDPWTAAAKWVELPKAAAIDCLAQGIAQMPLTPQALLEAHVTAARLILLLPPRTETFRGRNSPAGLPARLPKGVCLVILYCALAFGLAVNMIPRPASTTNTPIEQNSDHTL